MVRWLSGLSCISSRAAQHDAKKHGKKPSKKAAAANEIEVKNNDKAGVSQQQQPVSFIHNYDVSPAKKGTNSSFMLKHEESSALLLAGANYNPCWMEAKNWYSCTM